MTNKIKLPEHVRPVHYDLFFDIDLKKFVFSGKEAIDLKIDKPIEKIILHSSGLDVGHAYIILHNRTVKAKVSEDKKLERLILDFGSRLSDGKLVVEFNGKLTDNLTGLYRSKYTVNGKEKYLATTQFEAPYARQAFPCFDEPACKATFDLTLKIDRKLRAISNMPVQNEHREGNKKIVRFQRTPVMSTYLLYIGAGEFEFLESRLGKKLVRVVTTKGKKNQGRLALELTKKFLNYFEKYSGIPYPLPKLDMIAIPDFASGAMENWGAITFRELALLYDPKRTSAAAKKRIAEVIAHELWHQWSGNLVTMKWWNDLWLNESFATFMAYKAVDKFFPEWGVWEDFVSDETDVAFDADSIRSTHPIEVEVSDPHQLEEIFDAISYNKGGSVLRMMESYMGEENFRKGVSKYLKDYKYRNATAGDLWRHLAALSKPIEKIAFEWIRRPGYPLVTANRKGNRISLSQKRFVLNMADRSVWPVPLTIKTAGKTITDIMDKQKKEISIQPDWFKINYGQKGFYRVKYDRENLSKLRPLIVRKELDAVDRWGVQSDMSRICRHGEITIAEYLDYLKTYKGEDSYLVLSSIFGSLSNIYFVFSQEEFWNSLWPRYNAFHGAFRSTLEKLGWKPRDGESYKDKLLRDLAIRYMGFVNDGAAKRKVLEMLENHTKDPIHPDIRSAVFAVAAGSSDGAYEKLINAYEKSQNPEEKRQVLAAIGNFRNTAIIKKALDFSISKKVRSQDVYMTYIYAAANPVAREILLDWTTKNWKHLKSCTHKLFIYIIESMIAAYVTKDKEIKIRQFLKKHPVEYKMTVAKSFDRMRRNIAWRERNRKVLEEYLRQE